VSPTGLLWIGGGGGNRTCAPAEAEASDCRTPSGQKQAESSTCEEEQAVHFDKTATPSEHVCDPSAHENYVHSMHGKKALPSDLQSVVEAWDVLPQSTRDKIVAIAKSVS